MKRFLYEIMYVVGISGLLYYGTQHAKSWWEFLLIGFFLYVIVNMIIERDIVLSIERWETWLRAKLSVGKLSVGKLSVDEITIGRGRLDHGNDDPPVRLDHLGLHIHSPGNGAGVHVYRGDGDDDRERSVEITSSGVWVEDQKSECRTSLHPNQVVVSRYVSSEEGGQGAGGEVRLLVSEKGSRVDVFDHGPYQWAVGLFADLHGGRVSVYRDGGETEGKIKTLDQLMTESGRDLIKEWAVDLKGDNDNGGSVNVYNWTRGYSESNLLRATMAVNGFGNGAVSTWDRNGYRQ